MAFRRAALAGNTLLRNASSGPAISRRAHRPVSRVSVQTARSIVFTPIRAASSVGSSSSTNPVDAQVQELLMKGIECMANADLEGAREAYTRSLQIKETPAAQYNLALALYQLGQLPGAITAFERSLELQPQADAHTNVASAYILSTPPNAQKAIEHLQKALALTPEDGEIFFNMGVIFEASERLEDALREYQRAQELGIERAEQCIRNVGGKIVERQRQTTPAASPDPSSSS